jgi:hypothetical protein
MASEDDEKKWWTSESAIPIETPSCISVVGSSQSGKSFFVRRLIKERNGVFAKRQMKTVYCYNILERELTDMAAQDSTILLHEGLPDKLLIDEWSLDGDWMLILDDLMSDAVESRVINYLFTIGSHHKRATVIIMSHNLYTQGRQSRTISLNCHYFVLFQNRRDVNQVQTFARQAYPRRVSYFLSAYDIAMSGGNHSYMLVDLFPKSSAAENHRLRSNIFPGEDMVVYAPIVS